MRKRYIRPAATYFKVEEEERILSGSPSAHITDRGEGNEIIAFEVNGITYRKGDPDFEKYLVMYFGEALGSKPAAICWSDMEVEDW